MGNWCGMRQTDRGGHRQPVQEDTPAGIVGEGIVTSGGGVECQSGDDALSVMMSVRGRPSHQAVRWGTT